MSILYVAMKLSDNVPSIADGGTTEKLISKYKQKLIL